MHTTLVSILTPSFNQKDWLSDNLKSVAAQSYPNIEHIVVDGGSTDGSVEILQASHSPVSWRSETDRGQSHALNKAFELSSGEIIGWLNSDDAYVDRRSVATAVTTFKNNPKVGVVFGHGILVDADNRLLHFRYAPRNSQRLLFIGPYFVQPSVFIQASLLKDAFVREDLHFVMDEELWRRLSSKTVFQQIPIVVGLDRWQPSRKTNTQSFANEVSKYNIERGLPMHPRSLTVLRRIIGPLLRVMGAEWAWNLPDRIEPAIDVDWDDSSGRLFRQILMTRNRMLANPDIS